MTVTAGPVKRKARNSLAAVGHRKKRWLDHAYDRFNRAGATRGIRRGFKFRQFEPNEFARADELAQQHAQRSRMQPALDPVFGGQIERIDNIRVDVKPDRRAIKSLDVGTVGSSLVLACFLTGCIPLISRHRPDGAGR